MGNVQNSTLLWPISAAAYFTKNNQNETPYFLRNFSRIIGKNNTLRLYVPLF